MQNYVLSAANSMLNQRLDEVAKKADCPFVSAGTNYGQYIYAKTKDAFTVVATPKEISKTADALKAAYTEALRAARFGFTATEYKRFQQNYMSQLEKRYSNKDKRYTAQFYRQCVHNFLENEPMPSIEFTYETMKQIAPMIPLEAVNQIMKELVPENDSNLVIINFNNEKEGNVYPTRDQLLSAVHAARAAELTAYVDNVKDEPLMTVLPKAGTIKKKSQSDKFGYTILELSNGVRVLLKKTDYKKDQVVLSGEGGAGATSYGKADYANLKAFDEVIGISGLGNFSSTELQKALAGKIANADLAMDDRKMSVSGNSTPKDVETMLQMVYLYFTNIKKDPESFGNLVQQYEVALKDRNLVPEMALSDSLTATLYGHNWRETPLLYNDVKDINYDRVLQMAKERTANARGWVFRIIGNYDEATIEKLVCQYLGALPAGKKAEKASLRGAKPVQKDVDNTFTRKMETPKANSYFIWYNDVMPYTLEGDIQADIAGQVLSMVYLKQIREEASAAYSCGAMGVANIASDGYHIYQLIGYCPMKPEKKEIALQIMKQAAEDLAKSCDQEMLDKTKKLMLKQIDDQAKTNGYWLGVISSYDMMKIDKATDYKALVEAQTPEKISAFMQKFLQNDYLIKVVMLPQE